MAGFPVTGDQYREIDRRALEIKRQLNQKGGCPSDPAKIARALQDIIEAKFNHDVPVVTDKSRPRLYIPVDWRVDEHRKGRELHGDLSKIELFFVHGQTILSITGNTLREDLARKPVLNVDVLEYLLKHTKDIPEEWEDKFVCFWGTIYRDPKGTLWVPYLSMAGGQWIAHYRDLCKEFDRTMPAAIRVG